MAVHVLDFNSLPSRTALNNGVNGLPNGGIIAEQGGREEVVRAGVRAGSDDSSQPHCSHVVCYNEEFGDRTINNLGCFGESIHDGPHFSASDVVDRVIHGNCGVVGGVYSEEYASPKIVSGRKRVSHTRSISVSCEEVMTLKKGELNTRIRRIDNGRLRHCVHSAIDLGSNLIIMCKKSVQCIPDLGIR